MAQTLAEKIAARKVELEALSSQEVKVLAVDTGTTKVETSAKVIPIAAIADAIHTTAATPLGETILQAAPVVKRTAQDLPGRIEEIKLLQGEDLSGAMKDLQDALLHNPQAVALLMPEDIGAMTAALRRLTGQAITQAAVKKTKGVGKQKQLSIEEMNAAMEEL